MRTYINQDYLIDKISESSIYDKNEIQEIFNILEDVLLDVLLTNKTAEIRLLSGLKIHSKFLKPDLIKSNLSPDGYLKAGKRLKLTSGFTDNYKKKVNRFLNK